jgi:4-hydroxy-tetrahydrodipicolinate synthase
MTDDEQVRTIELAISEMRGRATIVAGAGSNDTRHGVELTERITALRPDALLHVNPYYNRPGRRGIVAHFRAIDRATDLPIIVYNIPHRTGEDMPNNLLAELGQLENIAGVKQANPASLAKIDGLQIYAGDDETLIDALDIGEPGGILTSSHIFGLELRRMVDEPEHRREIDASLHDAFRDMGIGPRACTVKAALRLIGIDAGTVRLPYVELSEHETGVIRSMLERHGMLAAAA